MCVILALTPFIVSAQTDAELEAQIRAALVDEAREQGYSATELDALVQALAQEAQDQGISSIDVAAEEGFIPLDSFETEEGENGLIADEVPANNGATNALMVLGGVLLLGALAWFIRKHHGHDDDATPPSAAPEANPVASTAQSAAPYSTPRRGTPQF